MRMLKGVGIVRCWILGISLSFITCSDKFKLDSFLALLLITFRNM